MKKIAFTSFVALSVFVLGACSNEEQKTNIAEFNGTKISEEQFYNKLKKNHGHNTLKDLLYEEILKENFPATENDIEAHIQYMVHDMTNGDVDAFLNILEDLDYKDLDDLKEDEDFLSSIREFKAATQNVVINQDTLNEVFEQRKEQIEASHILVEDRETANKIYNQLTEGLSFEELAREHSTDRNSAINGGKLGLFPKGKMAPEFENTAFNTEIGEFSRPIQSDFGFHIIYVSDKKTLEFDDIRPIIELELLFLEAMPPHIVRDEVLYNSDIEFLNDEYEELFNK